MDCGIVVSKFELQLHYYVHFRANTLGKGMNPPYPPSYGLNSTTTVLLGEWLWHGITYKGWYAIKQRNPCLWCNGYHRRKWTRRHESKSWTRLIAFHIALILLGKVWIQLWKYGKGMNPIIFPPNTGK